MKLKDEITKIEHDTKEIHRIGERLNNIFKEIPKP